MESVEESEDERIDLLNNITLDTPLKKIGYQNCMSISNDLIDGDKAPNHLWPEAWERVFWGNGTVKDLRDELYELNAELTVHAYPPETLEAIRVSELLAISFTDALAAMRNILP
jgi:hypothetical protein